MSACALQAWTRSLSLLRLLTWGGNVQTEKPRGAQWLDAERRNDTDGTRFFEGTHPIESSSRFWRGVYNWEFVFSFLISFTSYIYSPSKIPVAKEGLVWDSWGLKCNASHGGDDCILGGGLVQITSQTPPSVGYSRRLQQLRIAPNSVTYTAALEAGALRSIWEALPPMLWYLLTRKHQSGGYTSAPEKHPFTEVGRWLDL